MHSCSCRGCKSPAKASGSLDGDEGGAARSEREGGARQPRGGEKGAVVTVHQVLLVH